MSMDFTVALGGPDQTVGDFVGAVEQRLTPTLFERSGSIVRVVFDDSRGVFDEAEEEEEVGGFSNGSEVKRQLESWTGGAVEFLHREIGSFYLLVGRKEGQWVNAWVDVTERTFRRMVEDGLVFSFYAALNAIALGCQAAAGLADLEQPFEPCAPDDLLARDKKSVPFSPGFPWRLMNRSPDLRSMLELLVQHSDLYVDQLRFELVDWETEIALRGYHPFDDVDGGLGSEFILAFGTRLLRDSFTDDVIARVQFRHAARSPRSVYDAFFAIPVTFDADFSALVFLSEALDRPNIRAVRQMHGSIDRSLSLLRQEMGLGNGDPLADVRDAIAENAMHCNFSVSGLARRLALSERSLQRRLRASECSARDLLDEARFDKAVELLAHEHLSIDGIATRLGFASERGFRRAFQRWSGKSPAQARKKIE